MSVDTIVATYINVNFHVLKEKRSPVILILIKILRTFIFKQQQCNSESMSVETLKFSSNLKRLMLNKADVCCCYLLL